jgi:hypothetical protein
MDTFRRACNRGRIMNGRFEAQHHEQFCEWYRAYVGIMWCLAIYIYIYIICQPKLSNFAFSINCNTHIGQSIGRST